MKQTKRPLDGVRIIDFTHWVVGPIAGRLLANLGAEVIKVERTDSYDGMRRAAAISSSPNMSGLYNNFNADKLCITLNTRHPEGMAIAEQLIATSDAVVENFSAGVLDSWGLGWERLRQLIWPRRAAQGLSQLRAHSGCRQRSHVHVRTAGPAPSRLGLLLHGR
jgi:formyl-CoA transferase